jgi:phosphoribosylformylglycinamidine (FGAM) synthase-like enzyme
MSEPELTTKLTMHVNGGSKFSELHYEVLADKQPTGITIHKRTDGSPNYRYTAFEVQCGEETLDVLKAPNGAMKRWILDRLPNTQGA